MTVRSKILRTLDHLFASLEEVRVAISSGEIPVAHRALRDSELAAQEAAALVENLPTGSILKEASGQDEFTPVKEGTNLPILLFWVSADGHPQFKELPTQSLASEEFDYLKRLGRNPQLYWRHVKRSPCDGRRA